MIEIEVESDEELMQRIQTATEQYPDEVAKAVWESCQEIVSASQINTPVGVSGQLRANQRVNDPIVTPGLIVVTFGAYQKYAKPVEEGTDPHSVSLAGQQSIKRWAELKLGLSGDELDKAAEGIVWKIRREGSDAHPFFGPAFNERIDSLGEKIVARLDALFTEG